MTEDAKVEVTSAAEWRAKAKERWLIKLPSGLWVAAKRDQNWTELSQRGLISEAELRECFTPGADRLPLAKRIAPFVVSEPKLVEKPRSEDEIGVDEVADGDLIAVLLWALGITKLEERKEG